MSTISYLMLDAQYDPVFTDNTALVNGDAVAQAVLTRLNLFFGEWFENLLLGLPVFQSMLGQSGSQQGLAAMQLAVMQNVRGAPYVTSVTNAVVSFVNGRLSITVDYTSAFGSGTVTTIAPQG
jgi:hypothetical protein